MNLRELKKEYGQLEELREECLWVAHNFAPDEDGYCWLKWCFVEFSSQVCDASDEEIEVEVLVKGDGPTSAALKECRHSYWGQDGYVFYLNGKNLGLVLDWLKKYYDLE